jgi:hypothetical protein
MRIVQSLAAIAVLLSLSACAVVGAGVSVAGAVVSTTVNVTGDVIGAAVGGGDDDDD